jgi:GNAT superfamily N-acetyltransferase
VEWSTGPLSAADVEGALGVWRACKDAQGRPPTETRVRRVREKLGAVDATVVIGRIGADIRAMALAEPGRGGDGTGPVLLERGHLSMVFVHPTSWGMGAGTGLLLRLHTEGVGLGWRHLALWTGTANHRARRLYESVGYRATGRVRAGSDGRTHVQYQYTLARGAGISDRPRGGGPV